MTPFGGQGLVTFELSQLVQLDLGLVQLVFAARNYAKKRGIAFALATPAPVEAVRPRAGLLN